MFDFFLARKRVDAVIAIGVDLTEREIASLEQRGKPIVALGGAEPGVPSLTIDDRAVGLLATEHLLHLGHTRIAHLAGSGAAAMPNSVHGRRRYGFLEAMTAAGLAPGGRTHIHETEMTMPGGYTGTLQLLGHPGRRPTALFAVSDEVAFGAFRAAEHLGITIPGELSIIGIDGHEYAEMFGLTTVEQYPGEQGRLAVDVVLRLLGEGEEADRSPTPGLPSRRGSSCARARRPHHAERSGPADGRRMPEAASPTAIASASPSAGSGAPSTRRRPRWPTTTTASATSTDPAAAKYGASGEMRRASSAAAGGGGAVGSETPFSHFRASGVNSPTSRSA